MSEKVVEKVYETLKSLCTEKGFDFDNWSTLQLSANNFLKQSKDYCDGVFYTFWKNNFLDLSRSCLYCNMYNYHYENYKNHREADKAGNELIREFNKQTKDI